MINFFCLIKGLAEQSWKKYDLLLYVIISVATLTMKK